ncbi:MAG: hypothetical protein KGN80_00230 [Acidobacteriota bacterium]|nr:hypothetical protein [Acidobacteriota bacterium]
MAQGSRHDRPRKICPSCGHRLSQLGVECPVCGLNLGGQALPRPLLFQASALQAQAPAANHGAAANSQAALGAAHQAIVSPALGRVAPVMLEEPALEPARSEQALRIPVSETLESETEITDSSFWSLVKLEILEAATLLVANSVLALLVSWQLGAPIARCYGELWPYLLSLHLAFSWAMVLVPMVLAGQSLFMVPMGLLLASEQPERRLAFSLFHLLSVLAFPLSFLCMVLTPNHRTLAELLTGQEIFLKPLSRVG